MAVKAPKYWENLVAAMNRQLKERGFLTEGDVSDLTREVRGRTGGQMHGQKAQTTQAELADSNSDPYEDIMSEVRSALRAQYGTGICVLGTFADHIVYGTYPVRSYDDYIGSSDDSTKYYTQKYTENESTEKIEFGERQEVSKDTSWKPVDGSGDDDEDDDLLEGSFEDNIRDVEEALRDIFGDRCYVVNTWSDHVVYCTYGDGSKYYSQNYTINNDEVELDTNRTQVQRNDTWSLVKADDGPLAEVMLVYKKAGASGSSKGGESKLPSNVKKLPEKQQRQWVDVWNSAYKRCQSGKAKNVGDGGCEAYAFRQANGVIKRESVAAADDDGEDIISLLEFVALSNGTTTEKPWDGSASRYKDTAAYCKACLVDDNAKGAKKLQENCHLPVYEPNGALNLNAVRNAAARIDQLKGVSDAAKAAAARKLSALKSKHGIGDEGDSNMGDTPAGQVSLAGAGYSVSPKHGAMTATHTHMHPDAGIDDGDDNGLHQHAHTHNNDANHSAHSHTNAKLLSELFSADVRLAASAADTTQKQTSKSPAETGSTAYNGAGASSSVFSRLAQGLPDESLKTTWLQVYAHERMLCHGRAGINCDESARDKADAHMKSLPVGEGSKTDGSMLGDTFGDDTMGFTVAELRLADANGGQVPVWQQLHKIGEWTVPHGSGMRIKLTQDMGDTMIRNFRDNSLRRSVPLDEAHNTDNGGPALGWLEDMRWGKQGEGLENSEPGGKGGILYGRFRYNPEGSTSLANERFKYISPQYALDYQDKESGNRYGCTLTAVAATNNPFLRLRSIQGEAAPEVAVLSDGLIRPNNGGTTMAEDTQLMDQLEARLSERLAQREAEIEARFEAKLTEERRKREESDVELAEERRARHLEACHSYIEGHIHRGLPPAFAKLAEAALVNSSPKHEGTIKLDEGNEKAREINLHALVREMVELAAHLPVDEVRTVEHDNRPPNDPGATLDDQVITSYKQELLSSAGVRLTNRNGRNGRNGRVALAEQPADLNGQDDE